MRVTRLAAIACAISIGLIGCNDRSGSTEATLNEPATAVDEPAGAESVANEPAKQMVASNPCEPPATLQGDAAAGSLVYQQYCNLCHGPEAPPMEPKPADHNNCEYMRTLSDVHLFKVVCGGGTAVGKAAAMPAWRDIVPTADIENVIAHLRSFCPA